MIIRGEKPQQTLLLTPLGEIFEEKGQEPIESLFEEEYQKAFQKGVKQGERIGYGKAQSELAPLLLLLQKIVEKILEQKERLLDRIKPEVVEFSLQVCEKVIRQELSSPEILVNLINSLLSRSTGAWQGEMLLVYLSPGDLVMLENHLNKIQYDKREIKGVRFLHDMSIKMGDLRIEAGRALLNCDIARELEDLRSKVLQN